MPADRLQLKTPKKTNSSLTFANKITICRILIVPFFISTILYYTPEKDYLRYVALGLFMFAVISDLVDGYIARTRHQKTKAGAILDPFADKMLLMSAFLCLYIVGPSMGAVVFPIWFVVAVITRDAVLVLGVMIIYLLQKDLNIEPTKWGKATAFFQIFSVIGILLEWSFSPVLWFVTTVLTFISCVDYLRKGIKVINNGERL